MTDYWEGKIKVKSLTGDIIEVETTSSTLVTDFIEQVATKQGIDSSHLVRLVFEGKPLPTHKTLKECNLSPGSTTTVFSVHSERIGEFGIGNLPGADLLESLETSELPGEDIVNKLCSEVRVLHGLSPEVIPFGEESIFRLIPASLNEPERKTLIAHIESRYQGEMDLKYKLKSSELISLIGEPAFNKLVEIYGHSPNEIWLRRVHSNGPHQGINWHIDQSYFTMQVALNGDSEFQGGKLVFVGNGKIFIPKREAGTATVHGCKVVHAVTPLKSGPRYSLFFLHVPKYQIKVES